ncbi:HNH endonuclease, partial [Pseudomonas otitidis]|nr:HNH endonuclease [Pseudomonas otitidis]
LGRSKRTASIYQRLALVAREAVCSHPNCEQPASNCDVHHLIAWFDGGRTDLENLTLLCRHHHTSNNDRRDFRFGVEHYQRDAGVVKFYRPGVPPEENQAPARRKSAGYWIRMAEKSA